MTRPAKDGRTAGTLRCNRCKRPMKGTTAYDGACQCGGLIEAVPQDAGDPMHIHVQRNIKSYCPSCLGKIDDLQLADVNNPPDYSDLRDDLMSARAEIKMLRTSAHEMRQALTCQEFWDGPLPTTAKDGATCTCYSCETAALYDAAISAPLRSA